MNLFIAPFVNALFGFYYLTGNLGWSVIIVTLLVKFLLLPLVMPSLKSAQKMRELQPKLKKLQEKYKGEKSKLATAQMDLYKSEGVNPMAGCLPQILQIAVLLIFFSAFNKVVGFNDNGNYKELNSLLISNFRIEQNFKFNTDFLGSNLTLKPSKIWSEGNMALMVLPIILLVGSGVAQYFGAKLMMPAPAVTENIAKKTEEKGDDMMAAMRTQSLYFMPLMTVFIGWSFSMGLLLYWFVNSLFSVGQQLVIDGMNKNKK